MNARTVAQGDRRPPLAQQSRAWDDASLARPHDQHDQAARVRAMFDAIAGGYERINHVASLGQDARWRRKAVALAAATASDVVLDICCGTGDMIRTFAAAEPSPRMVIGVDFASQMLASGIYSSNSCHQLCRADGLRLPLADSSVDVVSCAFGVRNFQDLTVGLGEMFRVLRPRGRVVILEFAEPENRLARFGYRLYTQQILPRIAALLSRDRTGAYRYLPRSISTFETRGSMEGRLRDAGFFSVGSHAMNLGGVLIYVATKQ
ncbi:MAG: ubiquinone/menaquinone biosynthesis methyltransferase [Planctomycetes bacterium]|nr:ubiquinone/menaquinone biosynthesis methyltransferase [Planctomycetota bacterium]